MGGATAAVGFLPKYSTIGFLAPILLVSLRLAQGLALGGEYGGAATYVAEHAPDDQRGSATSWIQTTATVGLFLALVIIGVCRKTMTPEVFSDWGWRVPFILSLILLAVSVYIRLKLQESPVFNRMKHAGKRSKSPLIDSFFKYPNNKYVLLALLGATAGQGVVWYTGQFYALFFLTITLKVEVFTAYTLIALSLVIGTPFFIVFGKLSDKIGRLKIILAGCLIAMVYGPIAAFLVELFPTRIRYTSMSLPYHIGNGWFGGMLPKNAAANPPLAGAAGAALVVTGSGACRGPRRGRGQECPRPRGH